MTELQGNCRLGTTTVGYLTKKRTVGVRLTWRLSRGRTSLLLPLGAENPSYATAYLFHDHSPDGDWHPSTLSCKLLPVTRETKLTLTIALNPKSKLTLERGTNLINRNTRAC